MVVDDEAWARKRITSLLKSDPEFEVIGECADGSAAVSAIRSSAPDVVFLDVQMPGASGLEVVEAIGVGCLPVIVFVTAYDRYAIRAFDVHAVDYLLKPFDQERFARTLQRVREQLRSREPGESAGLRALLEELRKPYLRRIGARSGGRIVFLKTEDIEWIEATGNYLTLHAGKDTHLIRETMSALEAKLDPDHFVRVHRSTIVNLDRVKELHPWARGEQVLVLNGGTKLTVGRAFRHRLSELLENRPHKP